MSLWKKATFWVKVKDTFALGGLLSQAGMEVLSANELVKILVAVGTIIGYLVGMWFEDKDGDGTPDILQDK